VTPPNPPAVDVAAVRAREGITALFVSLNRRFNIRPCISACREREKVTGQRDECATCQFERLERWTDDLQADLAAAKAALEQAEQERDRLLGDLANYENGQRPRRNFTGDDRFGVTR
jgi:hypothetical protein